MIAIDTNVLLRYLLKDDEIQAKKARRLFEDEKCILITDIVLAESLWTLSGRKYKATKSDLIAVVVKLLQEPNVRFEDDTVIWRSLGAYRRTDADFADALIVYKAKKTASLNNELESVYTFDIDALQLPHTSEP